MTDIEEAVWRKASASDNHDNCVEVASADGRIAVRDSKHPDGPILAFTSAEWAAFQAGVRAGDFD